MSENLSMKKPATRGLFGRRKMGPLIFCTPGTLDFLTPTPFRGNDRGASMSDNVSDIGMLEGQWLGVGVRAGPSRGSIGKCLALVPLEGWGPARSRLTVDRVITFLTCRSTCPTSLTDQPIIDAIERHSADRAVCIIPKFCKESIDKHFQGFMVCITYLQIWSAI